MPNEGPVSYNKPWPHFGAAGKRYPYLPRDVDVFSNLDVADTTDVGHSLNTQTRTHTGDGANDWRDHDPLEEQPTGLAH